MEIMRRAGDEYAAHFTRWQGQQPRKDRKVSTISPHSLFFDKHRVFRILLTVCATSGCLFSAGKLSRYMSRYMDA